MSRYDVLAKRTSAAPDAAETLKPAVSRRSNPTFRQFSAYIPADLYRQLKVRLAERDLDLSVAVEEAIREWIEKRRTVET